MVFKKIMFSLKSIMVLFSVILVSTVACEIPETEIPNLYSHFTDDLMHLCPGNGTLILKSGVLAHVRFEGPYGPLNDQYLCHYSITHPQMDLPPTSDRDSPQSCTGSIIQQSFPSPAGGRLVLPGARDDFFLRITVEQIFDLLKMYTHLKMNPDMPEVLLKKFVIFFNDLKGKLRKAHQIWPKDRIEHQSTQKLFDRYAQMFAGALGEVNDYPDNLVESALLALAWEKSKKLEDLSPLLLPTSNNSPKIFSKEIYQQWKKSNLIDKKLPPNAFAQLLNHPEELIFITLAYDIYDWPYPRMLGEMGASHTYVDANGEAQTIPNYGDCGEAFARDAFNLFIADIATRTFDTAYLKRAFPNASPKLFKFIDGDPQNPQAYKQQSYDAVNDGIEGRTVWGDALSNLNDPTLDQEANDIDVVYCLHNRCSIQVGLNNMLAVFEKLFNDRDLSNIRRQETNEDIRRAKMISYILQKFSRDDFKFSWRINQQRDVLGNYQSFILTINDDDSFTCYVSQGHFDFQPILANKSEDWRRNPELLKMLITNDTLHPTIKRQLLPFYLSNTSAQALSDETMQIQAQKYANEIFYGSNMSNAQEKFQAFDLGLMLDAPSALSLLPQWFNSYSSDTEIDCMTTSLLFKHRAKWENNTQIREKLKSRIQSLYDDTLTQIDNGQAHMDFSNYLPYPYSDALIMAFLEKRTPEEIGNVRIILPGAESDCTLLIASVRYRHIDLTKYLLHRAQAELLSDAHLNQSNPLYLASYLGFTEIAEMLLAVKNEGDTLPLLLSQSSYIKGSDTTDTSTPLHAAADYWAAENGHTEIVKMLLAVRLKNDPLPLLLNDDYITELRGTGQFMNTPLHTAAQNGHSGIVKALVGNPLYVQQFLKYWINGFNQTPIECAKNYPDIQEIIYQSLTQREQLFFS